VLRLRGGFPQADAKGVTTGIFDLAGWSCGPPPATHLLPGRSRSSKALMFFSMTTRQWFLDWGFVGLLVYALKYQFDYADLQTRLPALWQQLQADVRAWLQSVQR